MTCSTKNIKGKEKTCSLLDDCIDTLSKNGHLRHVVSNSSAHFHSQQSQRVHMIDHVAFEDMMYEFYEILVTLIERTNNDRCL